MIRARSGRLKGLTTAAALVAAVAVAPASAVAASGKTILVFNGPAAEALRDAGIQIAPIKPARGGAKKIVLPVAAGLAGSETTLLSHRGGIALSGPRGKVLRMTKLRLLLDKRSRLSAKLGGREVDLFKILGRSSPGVDPVAGTVSLAGSSLKLTGAGAKAIAASLSSAGGRRNRHSGHEQGHRDPGDLVLEVRAGRFGTLSARAAGLLGTGGSGSGSPAGGNQAQQANGCPLPSGAGLAPEQPLPVATRPPGAADIAGATIDWHVRESFIRYVNTGEGTSTSGGATADPPLLLPGASAPLTYTFHFPFAEGWHDAGANPADPTDDSAAIYFGGVVRFLYSDHEIDLTTAGPEIEIAGAGSRAIFAISENGGPAKREVLVNLDLGRAAAIEASGSTVTYERVPGVIPSGTATSVFGGFYAPGTEFGCFTVSYQTG